MAIRRLNEYQKEVETKTIKLAQELAKQGAEIARMKIVELSAVDTGELISSVGGYFSPTFNMGVIQVTSEHAAFVEFGTGVALGSTLHPNAEYLAKASWDYGVGEHIFTTKDGRIGWIFPTDDGEFRFTEGMPSRPFMYETAKELERQFLQIAKEVFA
jgi:hypothetical protein